MKTNYDFTDSGSNNPKYSFYGSGYQYLGHNHGLDENYRRHNIKYQCPLQCHGEKTYDKPGICPDSKMQMIPVGAGHIFY